MTDRQAKQLALESAKSSDTKFYLEPFKSWVCDQFQEFDISVHHETYSPQRQGYYFVPGYGAIVVTARVLTGINDTLLSLTKKINGFTRRSVASIDIRLSPCRSGFRATVVMRLTEPRIYTG